MGGRCQAEVFTMIYALVFSSKKYSVMYTKEELLE